MRSISKSGSHFNLYARNREAGLQSVLRDPHCFLKIINLIFLSLFLFFLFCPAIASVTSMRVQLWRDSCVIYPSFEARANARVSKRMITKFERVDKRKYIERELRAKKVS